MFVQVLYSDMRRAKLDINIDAILSEIQYSIATFAFIKP